MIVTSSACDHSSRNGSGWHWLCLVIAAWQRSTNALSSRIEGDSCAGIAVSPSVTGGEADDADPEYPLTRSADDEDRPARTAGSSDDLNKLPTRHRWSLSPAADPYRASVPLCCPLFARGSPAPRRRSARSTKRPSGAYLGRGLTAAPVRSTARARSVRVVTPILWKMLRRWVSIVFWLKNSSAAICGLVLRSTTSHATWSSRPVSDLMPAPLAVPGRVRRCGRWPSFPSSRSAPWR